MGFWNKEKKKEPELQPLVPWDHAKLLDRDAGYGQGLPLGWYLYKSGFVWYGLRPKEDQTGHECSSFKHDPKELEEWLGVPLPEIPQEKHNPPVESFEERLRRIKAEAEAEKIREEDMEPPREDPVRKRNHRLYVRMSDAEYEDLEQALETTGMTQQAYILEAVKSYVNSETQDQMLQSITAISLDLSCEIQLLRDVLKGSPQYRVDDPEGWALVLNVIRDRENMKRKFRKLMEGSHGNR